MRNNKILAAAVASVLPLGAGVILLNASDAFAAPVLVSHGKAAPAFATQLFPGDVNIASLKTATNYLAASCGAFATGIPADSTAFIVEYKLPLTVAPVLNTVLKVTAALSGSAGWAPPGGLDPANSVKFCTASTMGAAATSVSNADCAVATVTKSSVVNDKGLSSVEFSIQFTAPINVASAYLFFCPDIDADFLKDPGTLALTMSSAGAAFGGFTTFPPGAETITIATSVPGLSVLIDEGRSVTPVPAAPSLPAEAAISFNSDSLQFATGATTTSMTDTLKVSLGRVLISPLTTAKNRDGSSIYVPSFAGWSGKLTVIDGPFSASTGANQVFLDNNGDCIYDTTIEPKSIPASSVTSTTAEWATLDKTQLEYLLSTTAGTGGTGMHVCVIADGVKTIEEQSKAPTATLSMGPSGQTPTSYPPGRLRHLKENGTKCSLYNIPDGTEEAGSLSTDVVSVRVTNNGPEIDGKLYATLYDQSGQPIYKPAKRVELGSIGPYQTIRYYTGQESADGYDVAKDLTTFGNAEHWVGQRATLVIATNLPDVSIFGLVRNRHGGPNMNMSTGATGNGCD